MLLSGWVDYSRDIPSDACIGGYRAFNSETSGVITHSAKITALYGDSAAKDFDESELEAPISLLWSGRTYQSRRAGVIELLSECADVERRMILRNLAPESAQARVVNAPGTQQVVVGAWYELERVAWAYAHRIEGVSRESNLAL